MTDRDATAPRKRLRVGHVSERGAVNAVRTLFEACGLVVDEVEGRSDYGRDLNVDLTEGGEITGAVIGVQVKGDRRFVREGKWSLQPSEKDLRYWAESSVPVVGVIWSPDTGAMRWTNLTAFARTNRAISEWPPGKHRRTKESCNPVELTEGQRLDDTTLPSLVEEMRDYIRRMSTPALLGLCDSDEDARLRAVYDCWALGRGDARAFILLRYSLGFLQGESLKTAIAVLSHLTPNPDIFWHRDNWVPPEIESEVRPTFRWSAQELFSLVSAVERLDEPGAGWERGGLGQSLWSILAVDRGLSSVTLPAIALAIEGGDLDSAFRILIIHQYLAEDPPLAARDAVDRYPALLRHWFAGELFDELSEFGFFNVY